MFSFLTRTLGLWIFAGAIVAIVVDGMRSIAASRIMLTSVMAAWQQLAPSTIAGAEAAVRKLHPLLWTGPVTWLLAVPAFAVLAVLGLFLMMLGTRRRRSIAYVG
jgi:hypothetical protein